MPQHKSNLRALIAAAGVAVIMAGAAAFAQVRPVQAVNKSSTIAVTNTFQSVMAYNPNRSGCLIQNNGSNNMRLFPGAPADATANTSLTLAPGQSFNCGSWGAVATNQISITGTAADVFYASEQ